MSEAENEGVWKEKLAVWSILLVLGGIAYGCHCGAEALGPTADTTVSGWSSVERSLVASYPGKSFDALLAAAPPTAPRFASWRSLPDHVNSDIHLTEIAVEVPAFLQVRIDRVQVSGFSGLAPPQLTVSALVRGDDMTAIQVGDWPLRLQGRAALLPGYWEKYVAPAQKELHRLEETGRSVAQLNRARARLADLGDKQERLSRPWPVEGATTVPITSASPTLGLMAQWTRWALRGLACLLGGMTLLLGWAYLKKLESS